MPRGLVAAAVLLPVVFAGGVARAQDDWSRTFAPGPTVSLVPRGRVVVVAGAGAAESLVAARSLRTALSTANPWRHVLDGAVLGDLGTLDDRAILRRATRLHPDVVIIVRVYSIGEAGTAVITAYDSRGQLVLSAYADRDQPLDAASPDTSASPLEPPSPAPLAPTPAAVDAPPTVPRPDALEPGDARDEYDRRFIGFIAASGGGLGPTFSAPFRGKRQEALPGASFYEAVGRPDLARRYRHRRAIRMGMMVGGGLIAGLGVVGGLSVTLSTVDRKTGECERFDPYSMTCARYRSDDRGVFAGLGVLGGALATGMGLMIAGVLIPPQPVQPDEARDLAERYNRRLRRDLGLDPADGSPGPTPPLTLEPVLLPGGAALVASGSF